MVRRVASQCLKLPNAAAKFQAATNLPHRIKRDWRLLAAAVVRLDEKVATGEARPKDPVAYALAMLPEMRSMDFPSAELDALHAKVERLQKSEPVAPPSATEIKWRDQIREWVRKAKAKGDAPDVIEQKLLDYIEEKQPTAPECIRIWIHQEIYGEAG